MKESGIIPEPLKSHFSQMDDLLWHTLLEHEVNERHDARPRELEWHNKLVKEGQATLKAMETEVQSSLWSQHATDA